MLLLLPMNGDDTQESELTGILSATHWATVEVEEGKVVEINFYTDRSQIEGWLDAVIVTNNYEPVMEFIDNQMMVLVAHTQRSIDDIVEAYLFRELHDLAL
jgi:predicted Fe-Mo cluster-binding NifX family protein